MEQQVPDRLTKLSPEHAIDALATAYRRVLGRDIDAPTLAILVAKTALETGNWRSIHCFNFGNVKGADPATGLYCMFACGEEMPIARARSDVANARPRVDEPDLPNAAIARVYASGTMASVHYWPNHIQCKFRAYNTAADGAVEYIRFLAVDTTPNNGRPNRYAKAWEAAENDDPAGFARELKAAGYYTASLQQYTNATMALFRQHLPACQRYVLTQQLEPDLPDTGAPSDLDIDAGRVMSLVAATLAEQARDPSIYEPHDTEPSGPPTERNT